jgi:hypothetical protein
MLDRMSAWLDIARSHCAASGGSVEALLQERLAPDMFTLLGQYQMATAFAKNGVSRLAGLVPPDFPDVEKNEADVRARIARARGIVESVTATMLEGADRREITIQTGPDMKATLTGEAYLLSFCLPQFYFHASMAYAILRHNGIPLGKRDFLTLQR